jgi:hypothetical protein
MFSHVNVFPFTSDFQIITNIAQTSPVWLSKESLGLLLGMVLKAKEKSNGPKHRA